MIVGTEWLVEAVECDPEKLRDPRVLRSIFDFIISDLGLKVIDQTWHTFEGEGGITGMVMLTESHLTCHTYPEHCTATFNLYCCKTRPEWDWVGRLRGLLDAKFVLVNKVDRGDDQKRALAAGGDE